MPLGSSKPQGSSGEFINHFTAVRIRVNGSGTLRPTFFGQDSTTTNVLPTVTMAPTNRFSARVLANVIEQRALLQLQTTEINDDFTVHRIIIFAKPLWAEVPA